jgi:type II secretory pathway component GspD/PulD (secretin)
MVPLSGSVPPGAVQVDPRTGAVTILVRDVPLNEVLGVLAEHQGMNMVAGEDITARVSITLEDVPFEEALTHITSVAGYTWVRQGNVLLVTSLSGDRGVSPYAQGRQVRVFSLDYVSAVDVDLVIKGLLSPIGQSFTTPSDATDPRKTQELVVVEDLPAYIERIEQYVEQVDRAPLQVLVEVHVLSVELEDEAKHGVNFEYLDQINPSFTLKTKDFAKLSSPQAFFFDVTAGDLSLLLEALETTNDAKTLASPKVFVLNGQEARIQVGEQLGYRITTTTQTSSIESVDFLDVGVVLTVTPQISRDHQVVMNVKPEVSSGRIDPVTELPEEETTEVETAVMLPDGHGIVIGGLIQETETEGQSKIPIVGDLWLIGRLFQHRELVRKRTEIIIALVPHIVPYPATIQPRECEQFNRATTPLLYGPLLETPRPWEPAFPDAGQRLPLSYKTDHLRPLPDSCGWGPEVIQRPCLPGIEPGWGGSDEGAIWREGASVPQNAPMPESVPVP